MAQQLLHRRRGYFESILFLAGLTALMVGANAQAAPMFIVQPEVTIAGGSECSQVAVITMLNDSSNANGTIPLGTTVTITLAGAGMNSALKFYNSCNPDGTPAGTASNSFALTGTADPTTGLAVPFTPLTVFATDPSAEYVSLNASATLTVSPGTPQNFTCGSGSGNVLLSCSSSFATLDVCTKAGPDPTPIPEIVKLMAAKSPVLVVGPLTPNGAMGPGPSMLTVGEQQFTQSLVATTYGNPCPNVAASPNDDKEIITDAGDSNPSAVTIPGIEALVTIVGTQAYGPGSTDALGGATVQVLEYTKTSSCPGGTAVTGSSGTKYCGSWVTVHPTTGFPTEVDPTTISAANPGIPNTLGQLSLASFNPAATSPNVNYTAIQYFALPAQPQDISGGTGNYDQFMITTSTTGYIGYALETEVYGDISGNKIATGTGTEQIFFSPMLSFTSPMTLASPTPFPTVTANDCSSQDTHGNTLPPISVFTVDGNGSLANVLPGQAINVQPSGAQFYVAPNSPGLTDCNYTDSTFTISNPQQTQPGGAPSLYTAGAAITEGTNQLNFYFQTQTAESFTIGASYSINGTKLSEAQLNTDVIPVNPASIIVSAPSAVTQSSSTQTNCSQPITISLIDKYGNAATPNPGCSITVDLSGSSASTFYSDSTCSTELPGSGTQATIANGTTSTQVYVKDTSVQTLVISAKDGTPAGSCANENSGKPLVASTGDTNIVTLGQVTPPNAALVATLTANLYQRLVGAPPLQSDLTVTTSQNTSNKATWTPYYTMYQYVSQGQLLEAAAVATGQDDFYNITVRNLATPLSNQLFNPLYMLNDFVTTWIGITRDDIDVRELLTGTFIYAPSSYGSCTGANNTPPCGNLSTGCAGGVQTPVTQVFDEAGNGYSISGGSAVDLYSNGSPYQAMDDNFINLRKNLVQVPQCAYADFNMATPATLLKDSGQPGNPPSSAGLLTTRAWGIAHLYQGTNRRAIREAMNVFLCTDITQLADPNLSTYNGHVRRDVDRNPGGIAATFDNQCVTCHGGLDNLGGAYAFYDTFFPDGEMNGSQDFSDSGLRVIYNDTSSSSYSGEITSCEGTSKAQSKVNRNCQVYSSGFVTSDDSWTNYFTFDQNASLDWDPNTPTTGYGVNSFGKMLANSGQFGVCMAQRVFTQVCKRAPTSSDSSDISSVVQDFQINHNMRRLYELIATLPECLSSGGN